MTLQRGRYSVTRLLGDGTFGRVLLAEDWQEGGRRVAVKVIRGVRRHVESAKIEARILRDIRDRDPFGEFSRSVIMSDAFTSGKHFCLVLEPCGQSLYEFIKQNGFRGFWMQDVQAMARQSLEALSFLHGSMRLTHTDLKPENILLASSAPARESAFPRAEAWSTDAAGPYMRPACPSIKLIDFGNATYENEHHSKIINTRQYRGPEVILDLGWNEKSDVWSMGCIIMELYTGSLLFGTKADLEHLALMERVLGQLPHSMLNWAAHAAKEKFVTGTGRRAARLRWPDRDTSEESLRHVRQQRPLAELIEEPKHSSLAELVGQLLTLNPVSRPSAGQGLRHPFFSAEFTD